MCRYRGRGVAALSVVAGISLMPAPAARSQGTGVAAPEPTYTGAFANGAVKLPLRLTVAPTAAGGSTVRVASPTTPAPGGPPLPGGLRFDSVLTTDAGKVPAYARMALTLFPGLTIDLEATRDESGRLSVRAPGQAGTLEFGAPLYTAMLGQLFVGRMYDWRKGGEQTFAMLVEQGTPPAAITTLKLTADGTETVELPDGPVKARKLRCSAVPPGQTAPQTSVLYIGPVGEIVRCDSPFFGMPLKVQGKAVVEGAGERLILRFGDGKAVGPPMQLRADRSSTGWEVFFEIDRGATIATGAVDSRFTVSRLETPWHSGKLTVSVAGRQARYAMAPGAATAAPIPSGAALFVPHLFATDLWEGEGGALAGLAVGEGRDAEYLPLYTADPNPTPVRLERLPDARATGGPGGAAITARHYRMSVRPPKVVATVAGGAPPAPPPPASELYTDGRRLLAFVGGDGNRLYRDGWEAWATKLPVPAAPMAPKPEAGK